MTPRNARRYIYPGLSVRTVRGELTACCVTDNGEAVIGFDANNQLVEAPTKGATVARCVSVVKRTMQKVEQIVNERN